MSKRLTAAALPDLHLTHGDLAALSKLRADLHTEVLAQYEYFLWSRKRNVDSRRWKFVRSEGDLHAYTERDSVSTLTPSAAAQLLATEPQAQLAQQLNRSRLMVVGTVPGTLDDVMYSQTYHDTPSLRAHWSYQNDIMKEVAVLNTMEQATDQDPFLFSGIAWCLRTFPLLIKDRDALVFDDLRLTTLRNGERVGINISHSINHQDLPELDDLGTVRVTASLVSIFRQYDANNVDVFMMDIIDNYSSAPESIYNQRVAKATMGIRNACDVALNKKLHYLLRQRSRQRKLSQQSTASTELNSDEEKRKRCENCERRLCSFGNPSRQCQLCDQDVCQKCVVTKELIIEATASEAVVKPFGFCVACILRTGATRALDIARAEVRERDHAALRDKLSSVGSDSTASTASLK